MTARIERLEVNAAAIAPLSRETRSGDIPRGGDEEDDRVAVISGFGVKPKPQAVKFVAEITKDLPSFAARAPPKVAFTKFCSANDARIYRCEAVGSQEQVTIRATPRPGPWASKMKVDRSWRL